MKPVGLLLTKILTVIFALTLLAGYVCFRQEIGPFAKADPPGEFPATPASPSMFSTPKSGPIMTPTMAPPPDATVIFSGTKSGFITAPKEGGQTPVTPENIDDLIEQVSPDSELVPTKTDEKIILIPGTKSINMPVFSVGKSTTEETPQNPPTPESGDPASDFE